MKSLTALAACTAIVVLVGWGHAEEAASRPDIVPFQLLPTKHILLKVKINGKGPYRILFDTGAPVSLLNTRTARATGVLTGDAPSPLFSLFGPATTTFIKNLQIGELKAERVPVIIMDHPTIEVISQIFGPVEGIVGFPFFARYRMTLDYQARRMTFAPTNYQPKDIMQTLMTALMDRDKPAPRVLQPAGLWGMVVEKERADDKAGVTIKEVLADSAAARAGLQKGDRLLTLDDRWTDTVVDCYTAASYIQPGTEVTAVIQRAGERKEIRVKPQVGL
jgi:hypothetical protein